MLFDGEFIAQSNEYYIFDSIYAGEANITNKPLNERLEYVKDILQFAKEFGNIKIFSKKFAFFNGEEKYTMHNGVRLTLGDEHTVYTVAKNIWENKDAQKKYELDGIILHQ